MSPITDSPTAALLQGQGFTEQAATLSSQTLLWFQAQVEAVWRWIQHKASAWDGGAGATGQLAPTGSVQVPVQDPLVVITGGLAIVGFAIAMLRARSRASTEEFQRVSDGPRRGPGGKALANAGAVQAPPSDAAHYLSQDEALMERGRVAAGRVGPETLDEVLDHMVASGLGGPRILRNTEHMLLIRLQSCMGCGSEHTGLDDEEDPPGCSFETGFLEGGLSAAFGQGVVVREVGCRKRGARHCSFEVWR